MEATNYERIENAKKVISKKFPKGIQIFDCRNLVGDELEVIWENQGIRIEYCEKWQYLEIFGFNHIEFEILKILLEVEK